MTMRKVAVFHNMAQVGSAWCCAEGIVETLRRQNYDVLNCGNPLHTPVPLKMLEEADLIILGAPEWYAEALTSCYGAAWAQLKAPKVAWYAESAFRDDRFFDFAGCRHIADLHYFPAFQDAETFGGEWLPFGADTTVFFPRPVQKTVDTAFLGTLYLKRTEYLRSIDFPITILPPVHQPDPRQSFSLLAEAYASMRIFVNMPAYSRLLVTKVTEVMACRTMLVTPRIDHPSGCRNMLQFTDGKHLVFYDQDKPLELRALLEYFLHHPEERDEIAATGCDEVQRSHTLLHRVMRMVADAEIFAERRRDNSQVCAAT